MSRRRRPGGGGRWSNNWTTQRSLGRRFLRGALGFRSGLGVGYARQMVLHLLGNVSRNRTGVCFLLCNAKTWQKVNNGFRLDL